MKKDATKTQSHVSPPAQPREKMSDGDLLAALNNDNPAQSIADLSKRTRRSPEDLQKRLARAAMAGADGITTRWWKREGIELVIAVLLLLPVGLFFFRRPTSPSLPDLKGRSILEVSFKSGAVKAKLAPRCVSVLFVPKSGKDNTTARGVWLLGLREEKDADWVAIAVPTDALPKINAALGGSEPMIAVSTTSSSDCTFDLTSYSGTPAQEIKK